MSGKITVRLTFDRLGLQLLALTLVVLSLSGSVAWAQDDGGSAGSGGPHAPLLQGGSGRRYYLTNGPYWDGDVADTACASGYHMASLWEILDVSNLVYNTDLGFTYGSDTGEGPPTGFAGWVRTGQSASGSIIPGTGNCQAWGSDDASDRGTYVVLPTDWTAGTDIGPWSVGSMTCDSASFVWCVED